MSNRRSHRAVCFHCTVTLVQSDREHYGYQCHACVVREHELVLMLARDPEHPDLDWLDTVPVEIGLPARPERT